MSHFCTLVILPKDAGEMDVEGSVDDLLAPYNENTEVERYREYVTGDRLKRMRDHYKKKKLTDLVPHMKDWDGHEGGVHDAKLFYWTTYNPSSRWDWYQIGGRWTGALDGYDPVKDPRNMERCTLCNGTGKRSDMQVTDGCNRCHGKGVAEKWPTSWARYSGDVRPVTSIRKDFCPFAVVTPDGKWHERGEMGWFGMASNEKPDEVWQKQVKAALKKYQKHTAVVVDCHI